MGTGFDRRAFTAGLAAAALPLSALGAVAPRVLLRSIPSSGERVPAIGMGSWLTFDVGGDKAAIASRAEVLRAFFAAGGRLIDSSPMYGSSQAVIGAALDAIGRPKSLLTADKVWTTGEAEGRAQIAESMRRWHLRTFDLLQVHNLVDWRTQLKTLFAMKAAGKLRYVGVTSYDGLRYDDIEAIMKREPVDFVQLTYNIADRRAEQRVLPLAADKGIGIIVNRPFQEGQLLRSVTGRKLPALAADIGAKSWAEFLLKFIISNASVTTAIPATRRVAHMRENMSTLLGPLPNARQRQSMIAAFEA